VHRHQTAERLGSFLSREFQETGFFVIKVQRAAFGKVSNDATKRISYLQFTTDAKMVGAGFVDGAAGADAILNQNKTNYAQAVAGLAAFISKYMPSLEGEASFHLLMSCGKLDIFGVA
jgi:hypothetical protein